MPKLKATTWSWKRGRGVLGALLPLLGSWQASGQSPMGLVRCTRRFTPILGGAHIQLIARWDLEKRPYEEVALFGVDDKRVLSFWSFTSDGKQSRGVLADVSDIHAQAVGFEAQMPAGLARQAYWPDEHGGISWAVEAKTKRGWKRFMEHHYRLATGNPT